MEKFITLTTFAFPSELAIVKSKLESEGIECRVLDENTVQVHNFLSQAIGGIRLQVAESNLERAWAILEENELVPLRKVPKLSKTESKVNNPNYQRIFKIVLITLVTLTISLVILAFISIEINRPTELELLTERQWCVDYIIYQDQAYLPYTINDQIQIRSIFECNEKLKFNINGNVQIPGFDTPAVNGNWGFLNDMITIDKTDTLGFLFEREYEFEIDRNELTLKSDSLTIYCSKINNYQ